MKKNNKSLFIISALFAVLFTLLFSGCKFNLSDSKYLKRPDIDVKDNYISIRGSYVNSTTTHISIYRQDVTDPTPSEVERVALLYPAGFTKSNQTYIYYDSNIFSGRKYQYYVRFVEENGAKNRTEWTEAKINNSASLPSKGSVSYAYTINNLKYKYNKETMTIKLPTGQTFTKPTFVPESTYDSNYAPALVFEANGKVQSFEVPEGDVSTVQLKSLLPNDFLYTDVKLLGIVGQKIEYAEGSATEYKQIIWTALAPISVVDNQNNPLETFKLEPEYGSDGIDYSITSDNEN